MVRLVYNIPLQKRDLLPTIQLEKGLLVFSVSRESVKLIRDPPD